MIEREAFAARIPYEKLSDGQRETLHAWCAQHDIDHTQVPIDARIERDSATGDWLVEAFERDVAGYIIAGPVGGPVRITLRRPYRAELPWPSWADVSASASTPAVSKEPQQ